MLDDVCAEGLFCKCTFFENLDRLAERIRHARQVPRLIDVADEDIGRLDLVGNAVEARSERSGQREVRVAVGAGDAALDAQAWSGTDDAEAGGAVVEAPGKPRRRPGGVDIALVRI